MSVMRLVGSGNNHFGCIGIRCQGGDSSDAGMLVVLLLNRGVPWIVFVAFAVAFARAADFQQGLPVDGFFLGGRLGQVARMFLVGFLEANGLAVIRLDLCLEARNVAILSFDADDAGNQTALDVGIVLAPHQQVVERPPCPCLGVQCGLQREVGRLSCLLFFFGCFGLLLHRASTSGPGDRRFFFWQLTSCPEP